MLPERAKCNSTVGMSHRRDPSSPESAPALRRRKCPSRRNVRLCAVVGMCPSARCTPDLNFKALPRTPFDRMHANPTYPSIPVLPLPSSPALLSMNDKGQRRCLANQNRKKKKQSKNKRTHRLRLHLALAPHSWPSRIALTPFGEGTTKTTSGPIKSEPALVLRGHKDKVEIGAGPWWPRSLRIVYYDSVVRVGTIHKIPLVVFGRVHSWVVAPRRVLFFWRRNERTNLQRRWMRGAVLECRFF